MRTILIAALLLLTATPALAEADWVQVGQSNDSTDYIDRSSISITGPIRRYWVRTDYLNEQDGWKQTKVLQEDNCASGQTRQLHFTIYMVDGTNSSGTAPDQSWSNVTPGSLGAAFHDYVCKQ